jgi:protein SCO1/2
VSLCAALALGIHACSGGDAVAGYGASSGVSAAAAADSDAEFGAAPDFRLTTQDETELTPADLTGRPYVLACIFTLCTGPCPSITKEVQKLATRLDDVDVRFVSLSVDPARDKPYVLKRYAEAIGADTTRWSFVTGDEAQIGTLVRDGFKLPFAKLEAPDPETGTLLTHDQRLTVVDAQGRIRGWYDSQDPAQMKLLVERVRVLAGAK